MSSANAGSFSEFRLKTHEHYFEHKDVRDLLQAALRGDFSKAKEMAAQGVDPNAEGPSSSRYNRLRLLHYAVAAKSEEAVKTLLSIGADPEMKTEGTGRALTFALKLDDPEMISLMLDVKPISTLSRDTLKSLLFESILLPRPRCLELLLSRGAPIDLRDDAGYTIMMSAMEVQDYDVAEELIEKGASVHIETAAGVTPAYLVEFHLKKFKPGTPAYNKVLHLKDMMAERGGVFPAPTPARLKANALSNDSPECGGNSPNSYYHRSRPLLSPSLTLPRPERFPFGISLECLRRGRGVGPATLAVGGL